MTKTTTTADAAEWADSLVVRHRKPLADKILGTSPHCTGGCHQGRALCVHPEACGVQHPVAEASSDLLADPPRKPLLSEAGRFWLGYVAFIAAVALAGVLTLINHAPKP